MRFLALRDAFLLALGATEGISVPRLTAKLGLGGGGNRGRQRWRETSGVGRDFVGVQGLE